MHGVCTVLTALLFVPYAAAAASVPSPPADAKPLSSTWRAVQQGIAVELTMEPLAPASRRELREGEEVAVRFTFSEATGQPLTGLDPAAWMARLAPGESLDAKACTSKVERFLSGSILNRPDLDLNTYYVLALNHDATISVVDPLFGFGGTKLLAMIDLLSPGEDWTLSDDQKRLFVSQPEANRVAVAETAAWKVVSQLDAGPRPARLALQPDGAYLWAGLDAAEASGVAVIDARDPRVVARIPTGRGHHEIAFSGDSGFAFVTNQEDGTVSVIDIRRLEKVKDVRTGTRPAAIAFSPLANALYVTDETEGTIVALDARGHEIAARMTARPGLDQIRFAPGGRFGFALNPRENAVHVLDTSSNRILQTGEVGKWPDQVSFSKDLAYIRHRDSETVLMIPLAATGAEGKTLSVVDFPGGEKPFGRGRRPSLAPGIVLAPEGSAVLVANPADQVIYYYKEGMAAPMGSFRNYDREPRAVLVVDRSLKETTRPGTYETVTKLGLPGRYEVALFLDSPRTIHCFEAEVTPDPVMEEQRRKTRPVKVEPLVATRSVQVGEAVRLRFRLTDPNTGGPQTGVDDLVAMAYPVSGLWQRRETAREIGGGVYETTFVPPSVESYFVVLESPSQHLPFHLSPRVLLRAIEVKSSSSP